ncbi:hypothetical protein OFM39_33940, partial [Escherichia coli]|nr:hypothetical protein [Escherichia coli]
FTLFVTNILKSLGSAFNHDKTIVESENALMLCTDTNSFNSDILCERRRANKSAAHSSKRGMVKDLSILDVFSGATFDLQAMK